MRIFTIICGLYLLCSSVAHADIYQWTDASGVIHVVDEESDVPSAYRDQVKVYHAEKFTPSVQPIALSPSRTYPERSQGAFAQKLALDLGVIKHGGEDALGPLGSVGIRPAGGWKVSDELTPEVVYDVLAAVRRAADSRRLPLSADGAEAVVRQVAASFFPPPPTSEEQEREELPTPQEPQIIIQQLPSQIIEVEQDGSYIFVPVPVVPHHFRHHHHHHDGEPPVHAPAQPQTHVSPTHMPFGASHIPFGTSHTPFGASHAPFGSSRSGGSFGR